MSTICSFHQVTSAEKLCLIQAVTYLKSIYNTFLALSLKPPESHPFAFTPPATCPIPL